MKVEIYNMKYQIEKNLYDLRILGEEFTRNNRNKGKLIINNKKFELKSIISVNNYEHIKIQMVLSKNIYNKSCMFKNCEALTSLSQINIYNYIEDLESMDNIIDTEDYTQSESDSYENSFEDFNNPTMYNNIRLISEISKEKEENLDFQMILLFNERLKKFENNYTTYKEMFYNCRSLKSLPDISLWNTNYIIDMSYMFYNCESLLSLPDISKWNINNVFNISYMFSNCKSLTSIPDISKWNTFNVIDISYIFSNCELLSSLPDISKWDTINVNNMSNVFSNCNSLLSLPDISRWNTINVSDMKYIFSGCKSILSFPDISNWNIKNVTN